MAWNQLYDNADPMALDLLSRMLSFNPYKRYTIEQCISHPYFQGLFTPGDEPVSEKPFDWSFDNFEPSKSMLQQLIYKEALEFHPKKDIQETKISNN